MITYEVVSNKNCNFKCYFCFANANVEQECGALSVVNFNHGLEMALKKVLSNGDDSLFVKVYGGESLIYTDNVIGYIESIKLKSELFRNINFSMTIITNGSIMRDDFLDVVNSTKSYDNFRVSLTFSMESNKRLHDEIRQYKSGRGSYDVVSSNMRKYYDKTGKYPHIQTVLSPDLLGDVEGYIEFLDEFRDIAVYELVPMFDDTFENVDISLIGNMSKIFDHYIESYKKNEYDHIGLFQPLRSITNRFLKYQKKKHCDAGCNTIAIMPNGDIYPCSRFMHNGITKTKYGHCTDEDISDKYNEMIPDYDLGTSHLYDCNKCQIDNDFGCLGKCLAISVEHEYYDMKFASVCAYNREFGKQTNRLHSEIYDTEGFAHRFKQFTYGKNFPEGFEEFCMRGGKENE